MLGSSSEANGLHPYHHELLTRNVVASLLGVTTRSIDRWVRAGLFPRPIRIGGESRPTLRFRRSDVDEFLAKAAQGVAHAN